MTGRAQSCWPLTFFASHLTVPSRTVPTLVVLVSMTGPSRKPDSSTQAVPVISPLPLSENQPAKAGSLASFLPRGSTAVTPVRTGPSPTLSLPCPATMVACPTSTPFTSVIALCGPGAPSNGTPRSRARGGLSSFCAGANAVQSTAILSTARIAQLLAHDQPSRGASAPNQRSVTTFLRV